MGLATLRNGLVEGALVAGATMSLAGVATWFFMNTAAPVIVFMVVTGLPTLLLAATLRYTRSLATTMTIAGLYGAIGVIGLRIAIDDSSAWWRNQLHAILVQPALDEAAIDAGTMERLETLVDALTPMMIALPAGIMFSAILTLLLARWWHAILDNPGGFGSEFRDLRFDPRLAIAAIIIGCIVIFANQTAGISGDFLRIFIILYLFQGLAISHGVVVARGASTNWLVALYLLIVIDSIFIGFGFMTSLLVITGLIDAWFDFRARARGERRPRKP
uniref:DUF2232 domain-containing protein n=1 Tax=Candidatus Kentrum sp. TUN TaxID=2126343 RepID=A0A451A7W4_9GAMM|nr:MAG: hypothetical protein BECKTUN1418D_GA0071000_11685 [Candidatus Kentron sp. TUN]